ncbi:MAG: outer membrane lipoprotein-sorting protein [Magnetococcus sp. MYC-9]
MRVDTIILHRCRTMLLSLFLLLACLPVCGDATGGEPAPGDADKILARVDRAMRPDSCELFTQITSQSANGRTQQISLYVVRGPGKQGAALLLAPDTLIGRAILRQGDEIWMHVPGELELRPSTLNQTMLPSLLNNADLLLTDFSVDYTATLLEEDANSYLLQLTPRSNRMPYTRQILRVDRSLMLPKTLQQYGANGVLLKTVTFGKVSRMYGFPRPDEMQVVGRDKSNATWQLGSIKPRTWPEEAFSKALLPKIGILFK